MLKLWLLPPTPIYSILRTTSPLFWNQFYISFWYLVSHSPSILRTKLATDMAVEKCQAIRATSPFPIDKTPFEVPKEFKKSLPPAAVCRACYLLRSRQCILTASQDGTPDWRLCHDADNALSEFDGMARRHDYQRLCRQLLFRRGAGPSHFRAMGTFRGQWLFLYSV